MVSDGLDGKLLIDLRQAVGNAKDPTNGDPALSALTDSALAGAVVVA